MKVSARLLVNVLLFSAGAFVFFACSKEVKTQPAATGAVSATVSNSFTDAGGNIINICGYSQIEPLTAGQTIPAGSVEIANDADNVYVTYHTTGDWKIKEVQLSVECNINGDCTQSKSSDLAPGKFPFKQVFAYGTDGPCGANGLPGAYTFKISKTALGSCTCYCVYPHAVVVKCSGGTTTDTQTAWGGAVTKITNGKWYGGTNYCLQDCNDLGK